MLELQPYAISSHRGLILRWLRFGVMVLSLTTILLHCKGTASHDTPKIDAFINGVLATQASSVDLGNTLQGSIPRSYPVRLYNSGTRDILLTAAEISVNTNSAYSLTGFNFPLQLAPGAEYTGTLTFNPVISGDTHFSVTVRTDNDGLRFINLNCTLFVTAVPMPEIAIRNNSQNINSGDSPFDFSTVLLGSSKTVIFTIYNLGTADLAIGGPPQFQVVGANASEFSITAFPQTTVLPLNSTTFAVQFMPGSAGNKFAQLIIVNNDADESIFTLNLAANAAIPSPDINVLVGMTAYASGSTYSYWSTVAGGTYDTAFTVQNTGTGALILTGSPRVSVSGADASLFSVTLQPQPSIAGGETSAFSVRFAPTSAGTKTAILLLSSNDSNEASYQINLSATVTAPEISVSAEFNGAYVATTTGIAVDLGFADSTNGTSRNFRVENTGNQALVLAGNPPVQFTGLHATDFSLTTPPTTTIPPGGFSTFTISVKPSAVSTRTATLIIPNNDFDESPYTLPVTVSGVSFTQEISNANYWKARSGAKSVSFDNQLFLFSGYPADIWSSADGVVWQCKNSSPGWEFNLQAAVVHAGKILVFDGTKIWQSFDGANFTVAVNAPPWGSRTGMAVVSFNNQLYLFGGYSSWIPTNHNDVWRSADGINWVKITSSSPWTARTGIHATVHNSKIFLVGGSFARDVWTTTDGVSWIQVSNNSIPARMDAALVSFGTQLYLYGGRDNLGVISADVYSSTTGASFTLETSLPGFAPRYAHTALAHNGKVFLMTGNTVSTGIQRDVYSSVDAVNFASLDANADIFEPRWGHRVVNLNGTLILNGGRDILSNHKNDSWISTNGISWKLANGNTPWSARRGHTLTIHDNAVYLIAGGTSASIGNVNREVWKTTDGTNYALLTSNPAFPARFHHTAVSFGGKLWIFGGVGSTGSQLKDAWYSSDAVNWTQAPDIPRAVEGATMTVHAGELYLAAGYCGTCTPQYQKNVYRSTNGLVWTELTGGNNYGTVGQIGVSYANRLWLLSGYGVGQGATLISGAMHLISYNLPLGIRDNAGYVLFDDGSGEKLWIFGGAVSATPSNEIFTMEAQP